MTVGARMAFRASHWTSFLFVNLAAISGCTRPLVSVGTKGEWVAEGRQAMVAADHQLASIAGLRIIQQGGNAVDAAVAVSFTLAVTRPESTGLGGGGFMIIRSASDGEVTVLDYRERAPQRSTPEMFVNADGRTGKLSPSRYGHLAAAVPGQVAGLLEAHKRFGTLPLAELLTPAIAIAEDGFAVDEHYVKATQSCLKKYEQYTQLKSMCPYVYEIHLRQGNLRVEGDCLCQPALGRLLREIAARGRDGFYSGPVARDLELEMTRNGGLITAADLAQYKVSERHPLCSTYRGYGVITMPPPSSGGTCIIEALNILESFDIAHAYNSDPSLAFHYIVEAMKHAFADRARWQADADYAFVPTDLLTSKDHAKHMAESLTSFTASDPDCYGTLQIPDDAGTSHFSVVDAMGNCVVSTETINTRFGSLAAVSKWGIILNNEMDDFTSVHGKANAFGLAQSDRNMPSPGKRPLSSMTPTIILRNGKPMLLLGASGGPRIISSVLNVIVRTLDFDMPLADALAACRVHHQWSPNEVVFDRPPPQRIAVGLRRRGHGLASKRQTGVVQAVFIDSGRLVGASDPRKGGKPAGM